MTGRRSLERSHLETPELGTIDEATAELAAALGAWYGLRAVDSIHLATAVAASADHFITNNSLDVARTITEITVTYPADLPEPDA